MNIVTFFIIWTICGLISAAAWLISVVRLNGQVTLGNVLRAAIIVLLGTGGMLGQIVCWVVEHVDDDKVIWRKKP